MPQINWNLDKKIWDKINPQLHENNWKEVNFKYDSRNFISEERGLYMVTISSSHFSQKIPFKSNYSNLCRACYKYKNKVHATY